MIARLLAPYRPHWPWIAFGVLAALATILANVALLAISGWFITAMAVAGTTGGAINYFTPAAIIRGLAILRSGGRYAERLVTHETTFRLLARLRVWLYQRIERLPPASLMPFHSGDLASRLRGDIDRLELFHLRVVNPVLAAAAAVVLLLVYLAGHGLILAMIEGSLLIFAGLMVPWAASRTTAALAKEKVRAATALTEATVDTLQGMAEMLCFPQAGIDRRREFLRRSAHLGRIQRRLSGHAGMTQAGSLLASNLALWGMVVAAIPLLRAGAMDGPTLVMLALFALAGFEAVAPLPAAFQAWGAIRESAGRIFALADSAPPAPPQAIAPPPTRCDIEIRDLTFAHGEGPAILDGLTLSLRQGERVALLGPVGSGKSTLIALLTGLCHPDSGTITLNGRALADHDPEIVRSCFAVAPQGPSLFTGTIAENLRLARPDAEEAALWRVLAMARMEDFVRGLPQRLDTFIGAAGLTLSGGQARRLAIARALLKDAPVLILDEPGEGLDYATEQALLTGIAANLSGRTLLLITHRAAGRRIVDRVQHLRKTT